MLHNHIEQICYSLFMHYIVHFWRTNKIRGISEFESTPLLKQYDVIILGSTFTFAYSITAGFLNGTCVSINRIFNSYQYSHVDAS